MDIEEARRRLAAHPPKGDPTTMAGETLKEKAARLRAEQGTDDHVRLVPQPDGTVLIWLPYVDYLDTQAGPVEVGLDLELAVQLLDELERYVAGRDESRQCPDSEFDGYGPQCQKRAGHNLCSFQEHPSTDPTA